MSLISGGVATSLSADRLLRCLLRRVSIHTLNLQRRTGERVSPSVGSPPSPYTHGKTGSIRGRRLKSKERNSPFFQLGVHFKFHTVSDSGQQTAVQDGLEDQLHVDSVTCEPNKHLSVIYLSYQITL